jgi:AcrR family transcriptional regulator
MDDVCRRAGCSKGGLYHHFASKRALLGAVTAHLARCGAFAGHPEGALSRDVPPDTEARLVLEIWAEAARDEELRQELHAASPPEALAAILHAGLIVRRAAHAASPALGHEAAA